jgi:hypothetical protein
MRRRRDSRAKGIGTDFCVDCTHSGIVCTDANGVCTDAKVVCSGARVVGSNAMVVCSRARAVCTGAGVINTDRGEGDNAPGAKSRDEVLATSDIAPHREPTANRQPSKSGSILSFLP